MTWDEELYYVVQDAISHGISPARFKSEVVECWREVLRDKLRDEPREFCEEKP